MKYLFFLLLITYFTNFNSIVFAQEEVDLTKITEKYWAEGKETELGVVQNRKYTTAKKIELGLLLGTISTDPFLSVHHIGGSVGYHFSPYTSVHLTSWKA